MATSVEDMGETKLAVSEGLVQLLAATDPEKFAVSESIAAGAEQLEEGLTSLMAYLGLAEKSEVAGDDAEDGDTSGQMAENTGIHIALLNEEMTEKLDDYFTYVAFQRLLTKRDDSEEASRCCHVIDINIRAKRYWSIVTGQLRTETVAFKAVAVENRQVAADFQMQRQKADEVEAALKLVESTQEGKSLEEQLAGLEEECSVLKKREEELSSVLSCRKQQLELLCDILDKLSSNSQDVVGQAVKDVEENLLRTIDLE